MNITALQTFIAVVETGSLVRASEKMHVTQSTVTARLQTLEDEIGQRLINRQKSGATLTPAGSTLLRYAKIMVGFWQQAKFETSLPEGLDGLCTMGCERELWHDIGQRFFKAIRQEAPETAISVHQGSASDLSQWLADGIVDVIITYEALTRGHHSIFELPDEELVLYSDRADTPMRGDKDYVFVDHGAEYRRWHASIYHDAGVARMNFDSSAWALEYITDFCGSAYLPSSRVQDDLATGRLFEVADAPRFGRKKSLLCNEAAIQKWPWFMAVYDRIKA